MATIPEEYLDLFDRKTFAQFATLTGDGFPHVTPVWIDFDCDAERIVVNTERHRRKVMNVEADPRVGVALLDPDDPYRRLSIIGRVDEITTEGAREHIEALAQRYVEGPYPSEIVTERVLLLVEPLEVF